MNRETSEFLLRPSSEYSPLPFWFWNDSLSETEIVKQIREMNDKGVNGFVIHPRIGIPDDIPYMSDKYLSYVKCAVEEADKLGMKVILYDEAMYPSGSAHGMIVERHPELATKGIRCEESGKSKPELEAGEKLLFTFTARKISDNTVDKQSISEYEGGALKEGYVFIHLIEGLTHGHIRGIHIGEDDWENPPKSADILCFASVSCFIELTHEKYYKVLSKYFGNTVIGIFTDEPSVMGRGKDERMRPWTPDFMDELEKTGVKPCDIIAMWYDVGEKTEGIRKSYAEAVHNRLTNSFYKQLFDWCEAHDIALVGHPGKSADIGLLKYFHIPGQDLVFRRVAPEDDKALLGVDSTQAKCSSDSARHRGRRRNLNECFACGGRDSIDWAFNADDMKWTMDWLFIRGVNMLVPHAFFYSLDGERRFGERPPDVGINNIWWKYYKSFSDYMKRMSYMMTDSVNTADTAVLCSADYLPFDITRPLYENQIEFNYLEKELIKDGSCRIDNGKIRIASQRYGALLIEDISLIDKEIEALAENGVTVIAFDPMGEIHNKSMITVSSFEEVLMHLNRDLVITPACKGLRVSHIIKNDEHFYILVNEGEEPVKGDISFLADMAVSAFDPWRGVELELNDNSCCLGRRESLIICAGKDPSQKTVIHFVERYGEPKREIELNNWYIGSEKAMLGSWTENEKLKDFCGTVSYSSEFELDQNDINKLVLDMGSVAEQAEVYLNDNFVGYRLWAPYVLDITDYAKQGKNSLRIDVTNTLANKYSEERLPSGLLDRVVIKEY
ncbi:MAG: hypothetical protein IJH37_07310 [Clostridia bacterium]|nr:hypothetical protein [Clostridia bacterium]